MKHNTFILRVERKIRVQLFIWVFTFCFSSLLSAQCCTDNPILDNGFETSFSVGERFPNNTVTISNNALTYDPAHWDYDDGTNSVNPTIISDATRASEGSQFSYVPNPSTTPTYNKCIGNGISYSSSYSCQSDRYGTGIRYIVSFDYMAFNKDIPEGGTGATIPKFEYQTTSLNEMDLYDNAGSLLNSNETAVAWNDVSSSWKTAYALVPATNSTGGLTLWFSHDRLGTCGMLLDNTNLEMIELSAHGMTNVAKGGNSTQITFSLNPTSNVVGIPNLSYQVVAPSGFTVSPTTGYYNQTTNFTLTVNSGDMISNVGNVINLTVRDDVNTDCDVVASIENPFSPDNDNVNSLDDLDDDNDGISDAQELCGTNPSALVLSTVIDVTINLDNYPDETTWNLSGPSGIVASGGPYGGGSANQTLTGGLTVTENGAYTFTVNDSYGDGLGGNTFVVNGTDFSQITTAFDNGYSAAANFTVTSINTSIFSCLSADPMADSDNDGTPNYKDADFCTLNSAGVCNSIDADGDGIINSLDRDSDNDGIPDVIEAGSNDTDGDGMLDVTTDADSDGLMDAFDDVDSGSGSGEVTSGTAPDNADSDGDGLANAVDLDADNDGIPDLVEVNGIDTDGDGRVDATTDVDGDGFADVYDPDDDGSYGIDSGEANTPLVETDGSGNLSNSGTGNSLNTDSDSYADYIDLDSDNDGIPDIVEVGATDSDNDGMVNTAALPWDADGDGLADIYDENASDGPTGSGTNGTSLVETSADSNGDGLVNNSEMMTAGGANQIHSDTDNISNHLDIDADNDGITDVVENAGSDTSADNGGSGNLNGRIHNFTDTNNDGWNDASNSAVNNTDTDNIADYLDIDSDNDGIADYIEGVCTTCPTSSGPSGSDTDGDGLLDIYETMSNDNSDNNTGTNQGISPHLDDDDGVDTDPDYLDTDADEDGSFDWNEGFDADGDGSALDDLLLLAANYESANGNPGDYSSTDSDGDGIPDWADNLDGAGYTESSLPPFLDAGSAFWVDSNTDGLAAIFDSRENGTAAPTPDNNGGSDDDWRDNATSVSLPVELIHFSVKEQNCQANVEWTTLQEENLSHFELEHSTNGRDFAVLYRVAASGGEYTKNYKFLNRQTSLWGIYRLKIVEQDGSFNYSDWIILETNCTTVEVYPNPVTLNRGKVTLDFQDGSIPQELNLYNQLGVLMKTVDVPDNSTSFFELSLQGLSSGVYHIGVDNRVIHKIVILE